FWCLGAVGVILDNFGNICRFFPFAEIGIGDSLPILRRVDRAGNNDVSRNRSLRVSGCNEAGQLEELRFGKTIGNDTFSFGGVQARFGAYKKEFSGFIFLKMG